MRRIVALLFTVFLFQTCSYASNIEILPTTQTQALKQNRVWSGVFQLAWNDLYNIIVGNRISFMGETPLVVNQLNSQEFLYQSMPEKDYYTVATKVRRSTKRSIKRDLKKNLGIKSDLIKQTKFVPQNDKVVLYGALHKDCNFVTRFDDLGAAKFGEEQTAQYFGSNSQTKANYRDDVNVLFYKSPYDFAISLNTQGDDIIYLYKTSKDATFAELYNDMIFDAMRYYDDGKLSEIDTLMIPNIQFAVEQKFPDLENKIINKSGVKINNAMETVFFNMSNKGLEALPDSQKANIQKALEVGEVKPREFLLNDTFVIFVRGKSLDKPYFALRVNDITQYQVLNP